MLMFVGKLLASCARSIFLLRALYQKTNGLIYVKTVYSSYAVAYCDISESSFVILYI